MGPDETRLKDSDPPSAGAPTVLRQDWAESRGIPPGTVLVNTYRVERLLGGGGMGEVYLARHATLGTLHAIKVIRPAMALNRQAMDLFYREARVLRGVRHDAVVSYDGFVRDGEGRDYLVMEYVEGPSLAEVLHRGPLSPAEVLTLRDRLAAGLAEAHRQGAVHRDLSPDNVILPGGRIEAAKLIDFGVCKLTDPAQETIVGSSFAGKYRYASPEQLGLCGGAVDARSDIYSLGLVLAAAAQGRPLAMGESVEAAVRSRLSVPDLGSVPPSLRGWLAAMLAPDQADRPPSLEALLARWPAAGGAAPEPEPDLPQPKGPAGRAAPKGGGRLGWAIGLVLVAGLGGGLYWLLQPLEPAGTGGSSVQTPIGPPIGPKGSGTGAVEPAGGSAPARTQDGELATLLEAGRDEEALASARRMIAAAAEPGADGSRPRLPAQGLAALAERLRAAGRAADAFPLAEALIAAGEPPPAGSLWALAGDLKAAGRLDPYFYLIRTLAEGGDGRAAMALGELYDPGYWSAGASPFSKPRVAKARDWYEKAAAQGIPEAAERLSALKDAEPGD